MWHGLEGMGWGWLGLGFVHMVLFWLLVIVCIGILLAVMRRPGRHGAMEILQLRYAKGEIDSDHFERMKRELAVEEPKQRSLNPRGGRRVSRKTARRRERRRNGERSPPLRDLTQ